MFAKPVASLLLLWQIFSPPAAHAEQETVLYSFNGYVGDAVNPIGRLLEHNGRLYGASYGGGDNYGGAVFSLKLDGSGERVLHSFRSFGKGHDGAAPSGDLIALRGTFYGVTEFGGASNQGTVFAITPAGTERVLHSFGRGTDGASPVGGLTEVGGTLYGGTFGGGKFGGSNPESGGTVFSLTPSGAEKVLYSFDTAGPSGDLLYLNGALYGTTAGGASLGIVFKVTMKGAGQNLYQFAGGKGAANFPTSGLVYTDGRLYGTTSEGGNSQIFGRAGTVFSLGPNGDLHIVHSFGLGSDGYSPSSRLIKVHGTLYGTTREGGKYGGGTVFSITPTGSEKIVHSFGRGEDGSDPVADLIEIGGALYGTTRIGGKWGQGTVFKLTL